MHPPPILRELRQEPAATAVLDTLVAANPRLEEVYSSIEWRLARQPEAGHRIDVEGHGPIYVIHAESWVNSPELVVAYRFDHKLVTVLAIRAVIPEEAR